MSRLFSISNELIYYRNDILFLFIVDYFDFLLIFLRFFDQIPQFSWDLPQKLSSFYRNLRRLCRKISTFRSKINSLCTVYFKTIIESFLAGKLTQLLSYFGIFLI